MVILKHRRTAVASVAILVVGGWYTSDHAHGQPNMAAPTAACTVPGTHGTIQEAVDDIACDSVGLSADDYFESVTISRGLTLTGAPSTLHGELTITGEGPAVEIDGLAITNPTDTTPPELVDLSFSPSSVDVTAGPQNVTVTMSITDDISGTDIVSAQFFGPSGVQTLLTNLSLMSGDPLNGVYEGTVTVLSAHEPGTWTLWQVQVGDAIGNPRSYSTSDLQTLGFPVELEVISPNGDTTPPELVDLSFLPTSVDVTAGPQDVTVTMSITDDISGTNIVSAQFFGPTGVQTLLTNSSLVSGDPLNGVYEGSVTVLPTNEPGTWTLWQVQVKDAIGNPGYYSTSDLQTLGFPVELEVISNECAIDSYESDNDATSASPITAGGTQTHSLCPGNDEDWNTTTTVVPVSSLGSNKYVTSNNSHPGPTTQR